MAAGMGTRISSSTNKPKSLLPIGNESIIEHTVKLLIKNNIEVNIVIGYKGDYIKEELKNYPVNFIENPFFKVTNSIGSLWLARKLLSDDDILLANADVFYTQKILDKIMHSHQKAVMLADWSRITVGDYFFKCSEDNCLIDYGKELKEKDRTCEYVGIAKISKDFLPEVVKRMNELVANGEYNLWWENILYSLSDRYPIHVIDVDHLFWGEVDTKEDYHRILKYCGIK